MVQFSKLLNARERDVVRVDRARHIDHRRGKAGAIPSVVLDLHSPTEECGQEEEHGKKNDGAQYDSTGNRRADNFTNFHADRDFPCAATARLGVCPSRKSEGPLRWDVAGATARPLSPTRPFTLSAREIHAPT